MILTENDLLVIYLALSTQIEDCQNICENPGSSKDIAMEAKIVLEKSNDTLDKIYNELKKDSDTPIDRPQWRR